MSIYPQLNMVNRLLNVGCNYLMRFSLYLLLLFLFLLISNFIKFYVIPKSKLLYLEHSSYVKAMNEVQYNMSLKEAIICLGIPDMVYKSTFYKGCYFFDYSNFVMNIIPCSFVVNEKGIVVGIFRNRGAVGFDVSFRKMYRDSQ
jgi:hypothetical protein